MIVASFPAVFEIKEEAPEPNKPPVKAKSTRGRKPKTPKSEPENDENQSQEISKASAPRKRSMTRQRKRKNSGGTELVAESSQAGADETAENQPLNGHSKIAKAQPRRSMKRASSSHVTLPIPSVEDPTTALASGDNEVGQLGQERNSAARFLAVPDVGEKVSSSKFELRRPHGSLGKLLSESVPLL